MGQGKLIYCGMQLSPFEWWLSTLVLRIFQLRLWQNWPAHRILCTRLSIEQLLDVRFEFILVVFFNLKIENMASMADIHSESSGRKFNSDCFIWKFNPKSLVTPKFFLIHCHFQPQWRHQKLFDFQRISINSHNLTENRLLFWLCFSSSKSL